MIKTIKTSDGKYTVNILTSATVEEVCFYKFADMVNIKHALQGATMFSIVASPCNLENTAFKIIEVAPQWVKNLFLTNLKK